MFLYSQLVHKAGVKEPILRTVSKLPIDVNT